MRATRINAFAGPPGVEVALAPVTGIDPGVVPAAGLGGTVVGGIDGMVVGDESSGVVGKGGGIGVATGAQAASPASTSTIAMLVLAKNVRTFIIYSPS